VARNIFGLLCFACGMCVHVGDPAHLVQEKESLKLQRSKSHRAPKERLFAGILSNILHYVSQPPCSSSLYPLASVSLSEPFQTCALLEVVRQLGSGNLIWVSSIGAYHWPYTPFAICKMMTRIFGGLSAYSSCFSLVPFCQF
jgi:hypothetical protein